MFVRPQTFCRFKILVVRTVRTFNNDQKHVYLYPDFDNGFLSRGKKDDRTSSATGSGRLLTGNEPTIL